MSEPGSADRHNAGIETLVRMAQQIAANTRALPHDDAVVKIAGHLKTFWTPAMRRELEAYAAFNSSKLDPVVSGALDILAAEESDGQQP